MSNGNDEKGITKNVNLLDRHVCHSFEHLDFGTSEMFFQSSLAVMLIYSEGISYV